MEPLALSHYPQSDTYLQTFKCDEFVLFLTQDSRMNLSEPFRWTTQDDGEDSQFQEIWKVLRVRTKL